MERKDALIAIQAFPPKGENLIVEVQGVLGCVRMEGLLRQSHHYDRVLATGKEQHGLFKLSRDLTHDEDRFSFQSSIRQRTVIHQVKRFAVDQPRAERVAAHALTLYDNSRGVMHQDHGQGRELLWAAAMLHTCGQHINLSAYHKHTWYLIRHGELLGYSESEHLMVAAIARYHRRSLPKKRHESWQVLETRESRRLVGEMALLLRLAAALDRRPEPVVTDLRVHASSDALHIELVPGRPDQDVSLERWSLESCADLVQTAAGVRLQVNVRD